MIPADLLASIHDLPINDKLSLIEAMFKGRVPVDEALFKLAD